MQQQRQQIKVINAGSWIFLVNERDREEKKVESNTFLYLIMT